MHLFLEEAYIEFQNIEMVGVCQNALGFTCVKVFPAVFGTSVFECWVWLMQLLMALKDDQFSVTSTRSFANKFKIEPSRT